MDGQLDLKVGRLEEGKKKLISSLKKFSSSHWRGVRRCAIAHWKWINVLFEYMASLSSSSHPLKLIKNYSSNEGSQVSKGTQVLELLKGLELTL